MAKDEDTIRRVQAALRELAGIAVDAADRHPFIYQSVTRLNKGLAELMGDTRLDQGPPTIEAEKPQEKIDIHGLSVAEAAVKLLESKPARTALSQSELVKELVNVGFHFDSSSPQGTLGIALARRARNYQDIIQVAKGRWALMRGFEASEIIKLSAEISAAQTEAVEEHRKQVHRGLEAAKKRGVQIGAKPKITAEIVGKLKALLASGCPKMKACKSVGITSTTYYNNKALIDAWREGDPWPPPQRKDNEDDTDQVIH